MSNANETHAAVIAEMRGYSHGMPDSYHVAMSWHDFRVVLARLEAAHEREVAQLRAKIDELRIGIDQFRQYNDKVVRECNGKIGNFAAMCEFAEHLANYPTCEGCEGKKDSRFCESCPKGVALAPVTLQARMALSAPPRNCDIMDASAFKVIFAERIGVKLKCLPESARELAKNIAVAVVDTLYAPNAPAEEGVTDGSH